MQRSLKKMMQISEYISRLLLSALALKRNKELTCPRNAITEKVES
jgi:hypothetical protein